MKILSRVLRPIVWCTREKWVTECTYNLYVHIRQSYILYLILFIRDKWVKKIDIFDS